MKFHSAVDGWNSYMYVQWWLYVFTKQYSHLNAFQSLQMNFLSDKMYRPGVNVDPWYENFKFFLTYWLLSNNRDRIGDLDQLPPPPPPPPTHNHASANPFLPHKPSSAPHLKSAPSIGSWEGSEKHQTSPRQHSLQDSYGDLNMKSHISPNGQPTHDSLSNAGYPPNHLLTDKDRRHVCPHCYKGFRSRQQLNQHNLVHSGVRKYHCLYCERAFKQLSHVQQHHRIHTGKPFLWGFLTRFRSYKTFFMLDLTEHVCLIWFFTSHHKSFSYKGTGLPGLNQY